MAITADDVRNATFGDAGFGRRGYSKPEVEGFRERIARTLDDEDDLTAAEVHHVEFARPPIGKRGYDEKQVDDLLDTVEETLMTRSGVTRGIPQVPEARSESPNADQVATDHAGTQRTQRTSEV